MKVLHISAECYPAAKAGGLGDVAGALPKYLTESGCAATVIIPKYHTKWILAQKWKPCFKGSFPMGNELITFTIQKLEGGGLGFPLRMVLQSTHDHFSLSLCFPLQYCMTRNVSLHVCRHCSTPVYSYPVTRHWS